MESSDNFYQVSKVEIADDFVELDGIRKILEAFGASFEEKIVEAEVVQPNHPKCSLQRGISL